MKKIILIIPFFLLTANIYSQVEKSKMDWFENARFGVFIHWGIYSVNGISESWSFHNKQISHSDYMRQLNGFTAKHYNPKKWADLIKKSGAKYTVITSKHHDGVALWGTKANDLSVVNKTPAAKDLLSPFINELKKNGIKTGVYFSLIDWTNHDYPGFLRDSNKYNVNENPAKWSRFLNFMNTQINELAHLYNPDLWWFDGDWEHNDTMWRAKDIREKLLQYNKNAIINGRLAGHGDYATPEQHLPIVKPDTKAWEICMTINNSWGYQPLDTNYKTTFEILNVIVDAASMGGNVLLSIGPDAEGNIPLKQANTLEEIGKWLNINDEAIFNTLPGLPSGHFYGASTISKDSLSLYLFVNKLCGQNIAVKALKNNVLKASVLGVNNDLKIKVVGKISWSETPGLLFINLPSVAIDNDISVIKLQLDKPLSLYRGKGGFF